MKLFVPPIEIEEDEGFLPEKDIFQRKYFGEELSNLIENVNDEIVVALDAPWGEGKTTFVKMWRGLLKDNGVKSIYFDAFKNDFIEDPFLALAGEIYTLLDDEGNKEVKNKFKAKAVIAIKVIGKAGTRIGLKALTAGVVDETVFEGAGAGKEITDISDKYILERFESLERDKDSIENFKQALSDAADELGNQKKIIFIIDELDRCKPSFALDLLEKIKHIFSIPGITFVLVMNREQMDGVIKSRYGIGIDSARYLQKFVHIWSVLPKSTDGHTSDGKKYLRDCLLRMGFKARTRAQADGIDLYIELVKHYNLSLREIERSLTYFAIIHSIDNGNMNEDYLSISIYLSIVKVLFPNSYRMLMIGNISYEEVLNKTMLQSLETNYWKIDKPEGHPLRWLLKYYLSNDEEANALLKNGNYFESILNYSRTTVTDICRRLETFK